MRARLGHADLQTERTSRNGECRDTGFGESEKRSTLAGRRIRSDSGAVMILALVYFMAMSLIIAALARESTNDLSNTSKFAYTFALQNSAGSATQVAINFDRYNSSTFNVAPATNPAVPCLGAGGSPPSLTFDNGTTGDPTQFVNTISVFCTTVWTPTSANTRVVTFYACPYTATVTGATCQATAILKAIVTFDDYPSALAAPIDAECNVWCGTGEAVTTWDWLL
jgi:hypothetical protein